MKCLACHALIVTAVLFGGDYRFNHGQDTEALVTALRADVVANRAQLKGHHVSEGIRRHVAVLFTPAAR